MIKIILLILLIFSGCQNENKVEKRYVVIKKIEKQQGRIENSYYGIVSAKNESYLSFKVSGKIAILEKNIGDFVEKKEIIAKLDPVDYNLKKELGIKKVEATKNLYYAAKAIAENAKKQYFRVEKMYEKDAVSKKIYDDTLSKYKAAISSELAALAQYEAAKIEVEYIENQVEDTKLKAPFSGYITKKFFDEGENVKAGIPILILSSEKYNQIRLDLSKKNRDIVSNIKNAVFKYEQKVYPIELVSVSPIKERGGVTYPIFFKFKNEIAIESGSEGEVIIERENIGEKVIVPIDAIFSQDNKKYVWIVNSENKVKKKEINDLELYDEESFLIKGLSGGEKVVIRGVNKLYEEQEVIPNESN